MAAVATNNLSFLNAVAVVVLPVDVAAHKYFCLYLYCCCYCCLYLFWFFVFFLVCYCRVFHKNVVVHKFLSAKVFDLMQNTVINVFVYAEIKMKIMIE